MKEYREDFTLSPAVIDKMSGICAESLSEANVGKRDILRIRLSLEEILGVWLERLGGANAAYIKGKRGKRNFVEFSVEGPQLDPGDEENEAEFLFTSRLLADAGLALSYSYKNGANCLTALTPRKARIGQLGQMLIAFAAAVLCALACNLLPADIQKNILSFTKPFLDMMFKALGAVSTLLIFFALCSAISEISDISTFNRLGKKIIGRFLIFDFAIAIFIACCTVLFISVESNRDISGASFSAVYKMILDIVPSDIVTPFQSGNTLQLIFLAVVLGTVLIILGDRVSPVKTAISLLNEISKFTVLLITRFLPVFIFLSIFNLLLSNFGNIENDIMGFIKIFVLFTFGCYAAILLYLSAASVIFRVNPILLTRKLLPVHLTALTTASSIATFALNLETSERCLGIPAKVANFIVPIGQVLFKTGSIIADFVMAACMAEVFGVAITPLWVIKAVFVVVLVSMATPPVFGAGIMAYTIIFAQLTIPSPAIAIAAVTEVFLDFIITACTVSCLQLEMIFGANSIGVLDKKILRMPID